MKNIIKAFEEYADAYDRWFDTPEGRVLFEIEIETIRLLMKNLESPFLEIGVGSGRFAKELGIEFGVDPATKLLEIALNRGIKVRMARGENLPFENSSFGAVFLLFTLCFVDEPEKVFSEAKRVLRNGGGLIIGIINRDSAWGELYMKKKLEGHPIYKHARFYSVDEVVKLIEEIGMSIGAYSSTLCQPPSEMPYKENVHDRLVEGAGFVCILAREF
jgi:SAM-dependent methyltransferase